MTSDIVERLLTTPTSRTWDSVGRSYDYPDHLPKEAAAEITRLRAEVERLTDDLKRANELVNAALDDYRGARAEAMERAAQIADDKAAGHLAIWGDESTLPETAIEHMVCAEALQEAAAAIRQAGKDGGAG